MEGRCCLADAGKIVRKDGKTTLDTGEAAGSDKLDDDDLVTLTNTRATAV